MILRRGGTPPAVKILAGEHMLQWLAHAGPVSYSAMGEEIPLTWGDIADFFRATDRHPTRPEAELLHEMGRAFFRGYLEGANVISRSPLERDSEERDEWT